MNESHFICPTCTTSHHLFGVPDGFRATAQKLGIDVLAELPLVAGVSAAGDQGVPYGLSSYKNKEPGGTQWNNTMMQVADKVRTFLMLDTKH